MTETKPSRICLVLHKFDRGGSPRVAAYLARGFADRGAAVELLLFTNRGEVDEAIMALAGSDVSFRFLGRWNGPRPLDLLRGLPALVKAFKDNPPDVIIAGANNVALITTLGRKLAGLANTRLFLKTTNPIATSRHGGLTKRLRRWTYRKVFTESTGVWTLSPSETDEMRAAFPAFSDCFRDVYNPYVTPAMLSNPGDGDASSADAPFILAVGRLTRQKRLERLISAFALIEDRTVRLRILGEGEERGALEALVSSLGLSDRVDMPGFVDTVAQACRRASLMVLTSDYEGLPAVILEGMAANCPILSTDCFPAARTILSNAEGCAIIERYDPPALAALIDGHLLLPRPTSLRAIAQRYSIANGVESHVAAMCSAEGKAASFTASHG